MSEMAAMRVNVSVQDICLGHGTLSYMVEIEEQRQGEEGEVQEDLGIDPSRLMAVLSYVGLLVVVPLIMSRRDSFVMIHAKQGLVILLGYVVAIILAFWIPAVGSVLFLGLLVLAVAGAVQALLGHPWRIPVIGYLASRFTL